MVNWKNLEVVVFSRGPASAFDCLAEIRTQIIPNKKLEALLLLFFFSYYLEYKTHILHIFPFEEYARFYFFI
jgi:hypothetical protein